MQVHWSYNATLAKITVYPWDEAAIETRVLGWYVNCSHSSTGSGLSALVTRAKGSEAIYPSQTARDILGNLVEMGEKVLNSFPPSGRLAFANFWFDSSLSVDSACGLVIGLPDDQFRAPGEELKFATSNDLVVEVRANCGFSDIEDNPYSICPTCEKFEQGYPTALDDFSISLIFPKGSA